MWQLLSNPFHTFGNQAKIARVPVDSIYQLHVTPLKETNRRYLLLRHLYPGSINYMNIGRMYSNIRS